MTPSQLLPFGQMRQRVKHLHGPLQFCRRGAQLWRVTLSSPWTMIMMPRERVLRPQEFCQHSCLDWSTASNSISNILENFWPRQCEVPAWIPRPVAGTKPSTVVVYSPPANFSASVFKPCQNAQVSAHATGGGIIASAQVCLVASWG